jgi:hypothetical protein
MAVNRVNNTGQVINSLPDQTAINSSIGSSIASLNNFIITARVTDIILNENHPKFKTVGEYNGIGAIYYEKVNESGTKTDGANFALPYDPQLKTYPLINEYVILINIPNNQTGALASSTSYFYLNPVNIWNHPHHDAYPNPLPNNNGNPTPNQSDDYVSLGEVSGSVRRVGDDNEYFPDSELNSKSNTSQFTFEEKANIHPLMPFMGDVLLEGRHGQSIRFGSTAKPPLNSKPLSINNNWSTTGSNGDPITILRNGQPAASSDEGWIPITENLDDDLSSIYLTSYQQLNQFTLSSNSFLSYGNKKPTLPSVYTSPQIILNSDNIVINSKKDNIFLNSKNSISLSSIKSVNVDSPSTVIKSTNIFLGDPNAVEHGVKGDTLYNKLDKMLSTLITLTTVLKVTQIWPAGQAALDAGLATTAEMTLADLQEIQTTLKSILSNTVKTL